MHNINVTDCKTALARLMDGNEEYINSKTGRGNISEEIRALTHIYGQKPYAVVITCSDSRVIPEKIFMVGIGEIFTIRVAGNVIGNFELGSIEYWASSSSWSWATPAAALWRPPSKGPAPALSGTSPTRSNRSSATTPIRLSASA